MPNLVQSTTDAQLEIAATTFAELVVELHDRATAGGSDADLLAEIEVLQQFATELAETARAASSVAASGLDLRRLSNAQLRRVVIEQRGPASAANFATRLAKDLASQRGTLKLANGGEITVR